MIFSNNVSRSCNISQRHSRDAGTWGRPRLLASQGEAPERRQPHGETLPEAALGPPAENLSAHSWNRIRGCAEAGERTRRSRGAPCSSRGAGVSVPTARGGISHNAPALGTALKGHRLVMRKKVSSRLEAPLGPFNKALKQFQKDPTVC